MMNNLMIESKTIIIPKILPAIRKFFLLDFLSLSSCNFNEFNLIETISFFFIEISLLLFCSKTCSISEIINLASFLFID